MEKSKISKRKQKDYSSFALFSGNLALIAWIILGGYSLSFIHPILCWVYLILVAFGVYYVLRKNCCKTCYYCKGCTLGFGKLPELFFLKSGTENVTNKGLKMFPYYFIVISLLPTAVLSYSIIDKFTSDKMAVLILIVIFSIWSGIVRRKLLFKRLYKKLYV
jgi:hypothetical protein